MSVDIKMRQRILKAVEDVRAAAARQTDHAKPTASIHHLPARRNTPVSEPKLAPSELHLMLPKPHRSIW